VRYSKRNDKPLNDEMGWGVYHDSPEQDGTSELLAVVDTETIADALIGVLSQSPPKFPINTYDESIEGGRPAGAIITVEQHPDALRVLLGDTTKGVSNLYIERHNDGWLVFMHPNDGDAPAILYFNDDQSWSIEDGEFGGTVLTSKDRY
jgi:hypothetical protein